MVDPVDLFVQGVCRCTHSRRLVANLHFSRSTSHVIVESKNDFLSFDPGSIEIGSKYRHRAQDRKIASNLTPNIENNSHINE